MIIGAVLGAAISVGTTLVSDAIQHKTPSMGEIAQSAVVGAVSGAISGLVGPEAGPIAKIAVGAIASGAGQMAGNAMSGKPLMDGVVQATVVGGVTGGLVEGGGALLKGAGSLIKGGATAVEDASKAASEAESTLASAAEEGRSSCGLSFVSTTLVATAHGEQAIGTLEVGEKVWAYNPQTKKMELEPIQYIWLNHDNDLVDLTLTALVKNSDGKITQKSEVIHTNEKHPFLTQEKGFIPVSQLKPGMHVLEANGSYGIVARLVVVPGAMWMYNLTVAQDHTYAVGYEQWIVHNCGDTGTPDPANRVAGQKSLYKGQQVDTDKLLNKGWTMSRQDVGPVQSTEFRQYIQNQGKSILDWKYYMETWTKGQQSMENHYFYNMWETGLKYFHHH
jgi:hypothetical protein